MKLNRLARVSSRQRSRNGSPVSGGPSTSAPSWHLAHLAPYTASPRIAWLAVKTPLQTLFWANSMLGKSAQSNSIDSSKAVRRFGAATVTERFCDEPLFSFRISIRITTLSKRLQRHHIYASALRIG